MTKSEWPKRLSKFGWTYLAFAVGICLFVLICPYSELAIRIYKFQTLITGMAAGVAALVAAWIVYNTGKETDKTARDIAERSIEIDQANEDRNAKALRIAGAATIRNTVQTIALTIISEAARPHDKRRKMLVIPEALPSLDVLKTQDITTITKLAAFLAFAGRLDVHNALGTWEYDPETIHPDEQEATDKLQEEMIEVLDHLSKVMLD